MTPFLAFYAQHGRAPTLAEKFGLERDLAELEGLRDAAAPLTPEEQAAYARRAAELGKAEAERAKR